LGAPGYAQVPHDVAFEDYAQPRSAFASDGEKRVDWGFPAPVPPRRRGMLMATGRPTSHRTLQVRVDGGVRVDHAATSVTLAGTLLYATL
jgi:hypothetical protein